MKKTLTLLIALTIVSQIEAKKPCKVWTEIPRWVKAIPAKHFTDKRKGDLLVFLKAATELCKIKRAKPVAVKCEVVDEILTITTKRHTIEETLSLKIAGAKKCLTTKGQPEVITEKIEKSCMVIGAIAYGAGAISGLGVCVLAK